MGTVIVRTPAGPVARSEDRGASRRLVGRECAWCSVVILVILVILVWPNGVVSRRGPDAPSRHTFVLVAVLMHHRVIPSFSSRS